VVMQSPIMEYEEQSKDKNAYMTSCCEYVEKHEVLMTRLLDLWLDSTNTDQQKMNGLFFIRFMTQKLWHLLGRLSSGGSLGTAVYSKIRSTEVIWFSISAICRMPHCSNPVRPMACVMARPTLPPYCTEIQWHIKYNAVKQLGRLFKSCQKTYKLLNNTLSLSLQFGRTMHCVYICCALALTSMVYDLLSFCLWICIALSNEPKTTD